MILEQTAKLIFQIFRYHKILPPRVNRIVVGQKYTGVEIYPFAYDPILGLAYTLPSSLQKVTSISVDDHSLVDLIKWSFEPPGLEKSIGIATLNAVSQHVLQIINPYKKIKGDIIDYFNITEETDVTFIGSIKPMISKVSEMTQQLTIIDNNPKKIRNYSDFNTRSDINQLTTEDLSPDLIFCTGSSLVNDTLQEILDLFRYKAGKIVVIGPSASMIPDILFDNGVNIIGGMKIIDSSAVLDIIEEGGGTKTFKQFGKKYNLIRQ